MSTQETLSDLQARLEKIQTILIQAKKQNNTEVYEHTLYMEQDLRNEIESLQTKELQNQIKLF